MTEVFDVEDRCQRVQGEATKDIQANRMENGGWMQEREGNNDCHEHELDATSAIKNYK